MLTPVHCKRHAGKPDNSSDVSPIRHTIAHKKSGPVRAALFRVHEMRQDKKLDNIQWDFSMRCIMPFTMLSVPTSPYSPAVSITSTINDSKVS